VTSTCFNRLVTRWGTAPIHALGGRSARALATRFKKIAFSRSWINARHMQKNVPCLMVHAID
jgi:hypothetical protein